MQGTMCMTHHLVCLGGNSHCGADHSEFSSGWVFIILSSFFWILLNVFIGHIVSNDEMHDREGSDDGDGPKRSQTRRLAHR